MKFRTLAIVLLTVMLVACGNGVAPVVLTATVMPASTATVVAPTVVPPTAIVATSVPVPTATTPLQPTPITPAPTDTLVVSPTATSTAVPTAVRPRPTATSSGPLSAMIYVANCRSAPSAEKPGRVIVQISIEASGGSGTYRYFYQDKEFPTKFIDVIGEKGTRSIGEVVVTSGDGQEFRKEFDIGIGGLSCP